MAAINIAIVCDGTSDLCIQDLIQEITDSSFPDQAFRITAAREVIPAHGTLGERIKRAYSDYEPNIIVCHRDAETMNLDDRLLEIRSAFDPKEIPIPIVPAVPVRMIESWLLTNAHAIRCAADNRNGTVALNLPNRKAIEKLIDPKQTLFLALRTASNLPTQRLRKFNEHRARSRVASFIDNFEELRKLNSFSNFEAHLINAISLQCA